MAAIDFSTETSGVYLPSELSGEIWQKIQEASAVAGLANRMTLPGPGVTVEIVTGDPTPQWLDAETDERPVSRGSLATKTMKGSVLGVIVPFSNKFRRDAGALYNALVQRLPGVLAGTIDQTIFHGTAPNSNFDVLTGATAVSLVPGDTDTWDAYDQLVDTEVAIAESGYQLSSFALSARGVGLLRKVRDANGYPILGAMDGLDTLLGYPVRRTQYVHATTTGVPDLLGVAGDWSTATLGYVQDVTISTTDQASIVDNGVTLHLWQRDMFAVKAEIEVGFRVQDVAAFRRLTGNIPA